MSNPVRHGIRTPVRFFGSLVAAAAALTLAPAGAATTPPDVTGAPDFAPGALIVAFDRNAARDEREDVAADAKLGGEERIAGGVWRLEIRDRRSVLETIAELRDERAVDYAVPDYTTQVSGFIPNDPGWSSGDAGDWRKLQWNFDGPAGVRAPGAWDLAKERGAAGGRGVTIAVIDTGVAYLDEGRYVRAPDLSSRRWAEDRDYVDDDPKAYDETYDGDGTPNTGMGHGTHVAGTIRQKTDNGRAVTGLAYKSRVMPVRVLDPNGVGKTSSLIQGIRFAANHDADVINLSLELRADVSNAAVAPLQDAVDYAHERDVVVVAAGGNHDRAGLIAPASLDHVIAVGATTANKCKAEYSNTGQGLDLSAPGGGDDELPGESGPDLENCRADDSGRPVYQQTFDCSPARSSACTKFGLPSDYEGTSMAAPHVSAAAALVIATGRVGSDPSPEAVERRLEVTARDLGALGDDLRYGAGLVNAAAAIR